MQTIASQNSSVETNQNSNAQLLTFMINGEEYGVPILSVQEIRGWTLPTPLPNAPPHVHGVTNLRGTIVPIIDLRSRLGLDSFEPGPTTVIIVVRVQGEGKDRIIGLVVDAVSDVYSIREEDRKPAPDFGPGQEAYTSGLVTMEDKILIILNLERITQNADITSELQGAA